MGEGEEGGEGVGCFFLRFAPVAVAGGGGGFEAGVWRVGGGGEGGDFGGGGGEEDDLFGEEGFEGEGGGGEGGFEEAEFGRYEEFLGGGGDGEVGVDAGGEVGDCGGGREGEGVVFAVVGECDADGLFCWGWRWGRGFCRWRVVVCHGFFEGLETLVILVVAKARGSGENAGWYLLSVVYSVKEGHRLDQADLSPSNRHWSRRSQLLSHSSNNMIVQSISLKDYQSSTRCYSLDNVDAYRERSSQPRHVYLQGYVARELL